MTTPKLEVVVSFVDKKFAELTSFILNHSVFPNRIVFHFHLEIHLINFRCFESPSFNHWFHFNWIYINNRIFKRWCSLHASRIPFRGDTRYSAWQRSLSWLLCFFDLFCIYSLLRSFKRSVISWAIVDNWTWLLPIRKVNMRLW